MPAMDIEVAIAGAGPAGARAAALLARRGHAVEVFEASRLSQPKLCGGLLNRRCQQLLDAAGLALPDSVRVGAGQPALEYPALEYHDLTHRLRGRYQPGYRNIDRGAFDTWLRELAHQAGAAIDTGQRVSGLRSTENSVSFSSTSRQHPASQLTARALCDATGSSALSRRRLGPGAPPALDCLQGEVVLDPAPAAMWAVYHPAFHPFFAWIIPKGGGRFLAGAGFGRRLSLGDGPDGAWTALRVLLEYLDWRGHRVELATRPRGARLACSLASRALWWGNGPVYAVGEAAGLVSPFSGEGLSYALASAEAVAECLTHGLPPQAMRPRLAYDLAHLSRARAKAWIAASEGLRPIGLALLPWSGAGAVERLPWRVPAR